MCVCAHESVLDCALHSWWLVARVWCYHLHIDTRMHTHTHTHTHTATSCLHWSMSPSPGRPQWLAGCLGSTASTSTRLEPMTWAWTGMEARNHTSNKWINGETPNGCHVSVPLSLCLCLSLSHRHTGTLNISTHTCFRLALSPYFSPPPLHLRSILQVGWREH